MIDKQVRPLRIGCVSYLNAKPLIEPLANDPRATITYAVPSALVGLVESGQVNAGLLSVVDFENSTVPLELLPAGMIGSDGATLTVRIFSKAPPHRITVLHADTDSHTSVILGQLILREGYATAPRVVCFHAGEKTSDAEALLLIGDKVVNAAPPADAYPHQLDLGEQWKRLTGLPFVFAMWMARAGEAHGEMFRLLADAQQRGAAMTESLLDRYAAEKRWPRDLARRYFTEYLRYRVTPQAKDGLSRFFELARKHGLLGQTRPLKYFEG